MRRSAISSFELMYNAFQKAGKNVKLPCTRMAT